MLLTFCRAKAAAFLFIFRAPTLTVLPPKVSFPAPPALWDAEPAAFSEL